MTVHVGSHFGSRRRCLGTWLLPTERIFEFRKRDQGNRFPAAEPVKIANALGLAVWDRGSGGTMWAAVDAGRYQNVI